MNDGDDAAELLLLLLLRGDRATPHRPRRSIASDCFPLHL